MDLELLVLLSQTLKPNESEMAGEPSGSPSNTEWTELNKSNRMIMPQRHITANNKAQS